MQNSAAKNAKQLDKESPQQKTRPTHKHTYKLTYKHTYKSKQTHTYKQYSQKQSRHIHNNALPTAPHKTKQQKNITLYNSKYCIR